MRLAVLALTGGVVAAVAVGAGYFALGPGSGAAPESDGPAAQWVVNTEGSDIGGPFTLTSHEGERVSSDELIDGPTLLYFGYTWCPDVCPIDTQVMIDAVNRLEEKGIAVDPVFVTVDPGRDDVEALSHYTDAFHPRMVGLTGTMEEIRRATEAYKAYFSIEKTEPDQEDYLVNHTAFTYFLTPDGLQAMFRHNTPPEAMAAEIARILEARGLTG